MSRQKKERTYKIYFIEFLLPLIDFIVTNVGRYSKRRCRMKTALFTFIVGRSSFIELKNAGRLRTAFISIACMRFRRGRPEQGVPLRILWIAKVYDDARMGFDEISQRAKKAWDSPYATPIGVSWLFCFCLSFVSAIIFCIQKQDLCTVMCAGPV